MKTLKTPLFLTVLVIACFAAKGQGIVYFSYGTGAYVSGANSRQEFAVDLNTDGITDFRFIGESPFSGGFYLEPRSQNKVLGYLITSEYRVRKLDAVAQISASAGQGLEWVGYRPQPLSSVTGPTLLYSLSIGQSYGEFAARRLGQATEGYVGLQFLAADGLHFGWIRVRGGYDNDGTILDYAYNTVPGQSIMAGAVPEPSTWALLGLGALCLWRFRRPA